MNYHSYCTVSHVRQIGFKLDILIFLILQKASEIFVKPFICITDFFFRLQRSSFTWILFNIVVIFIFLDSRDKLVLVNLMVSLFPYQVFLFSTKSI